MTLLIECPPGEPDVLEEDSSLGLRLARGDDHALEAVLARHGEEIARLVRRLLGWQAADADDITQEVFVQVFLKRKSFRGESSLKTWLMRIAINRVRSFQRRRTFGIDA